MEEKKQVKFTGILFAIYILAVIWIILFKMQFTMAGLNNSRTLNMIPFAGSVVVNGEFFIQEIMDNILIFVPFGIYICMLKQKWPLWKKTLPVFLTSLTLEVLQYVLAVGSADITDLIGNTLGGIIGIGIFYLFFIFFREKTCKIINVIACIGTVGIVGLIGILLISNM